MDTKPEIVEYSATNTAAVGSEAAIASTLHESVQTEDEKVQERKRDVLVLILRFLYDYGYVNAYQALCSESHLSLNQIDVADNVDLWTIVQEYMDYFLARFGKVPVLTKHTYPDFPVNQLLAPGSSNVAAYQISTLNPLVHGTSALAANSAYMLGPPLNLLNSGSVHGQAPMHSRRFCPPENQGSTTLMGSNIALSQADYVQVLRTNYNANPADLFCFARPKRTNTKRRSQHLNLTDAQEDALYALVGCANLGWAIKSISPETRAVLQERFGIDKEILQLFFKNRSQKVRRVDQPSQ